MILLIFIIDATTRVAFFYERPQGKHTLPSHCTHPDDCTIGESRIHKLINSCILCRNYRR